MFCSQEVPAFEWYPIFRILAALTESRRTCVILSLYRFGLKLALRLRQANGQWRASGIRSGSSYS